MPPLLLTLFWLLPLRLEGKRIRVYAMRLLGPLGAEIEAKRWAMTEADLYAFDARLCAIEEALARRLVGGWRLLGERSDDIVDAERLRVRCAAVWALLFSAAETRSDRPPRRRGMLNRIRRVWAVTNRRRTPAYRRRRLRRPPAAALEFSD